MSGTGSGEVPTDLGELADLPPEALETLAANAGLPPGAVLVGATVRPLEESADLDVQFDPDLAFGLPAEDPLGPGALVDRPEGAGSDSAAPTTRAGSTGSSPGGGAENPLATRAKAKALGKLAAAAFAAITGLANLRLRLDEDDETWLADKEDLAAVSAPAGRMIARHAALPGGEDASDLSDGIDIGIGVAGYLIKNSLQHAAIRRERRRAQAPAAAEA